MKRAWVWTGAVFALAVWAAQPRAVAQPPVASDKAALLQDAYVFGYPLVTMEMTRRVITNAAKPGDKSAPMGQFAHMRDYPTPQFHEVTAPNADTLYSSAWLHLSKEPY